METRHTWIFKLLWWLTFVVLAFVIIILVNREWLLKALAQRQIRQATGMEAEIGHFTFNLLSPNVTFENLHIYNKPEFGGTQFLDLAELHAEYDLAALRQHELHITFMRVNLHELDVVKNQAGATNIMAIAEAMAPRKASGERSIAPLNGYKFKVIDVLNLSIGSVKFVDLNNPQRDRTANIRIENLIFTNVMSSADLPGLSGQLWYRGGTAVGLPVHPPVRKPVPVSVPEPAVKPTSP
jgi:hypothetical protein